MNDQDHNSDHTRRVDRVHSHATAYLGTWALATVVFTSSLLAVEPKTDSKVTKERKSKLSRRLIDETVKGQSQDLMGEIIRLMNGSAKHLEIDFNPGETTQSLQQQVLDQLDMAIKQAGRQRRPNPKNQKQSKSDKRKAGDQKSQQSKMDGSKDSDAKQEGQSPRPGEPPATGSESKDGKLEESRRGWGALPQRKRDEVIQGASEAHLQQYREWIEQYYRALQESQE